MSRARRFEELRRTAAETMQVIEQGFYEGEFGRQKLPEHDYTDVICVPPEQAEEIRQVAEQNIPAGHRPLMLLTDADSFTVAQSLDNCLVMNFANAYNPGGGFLEGCNAQEECLCRESTLYKSIGSARAAAMYNYNKKLHSPAESDYMLISPHVCVFRDVKDNFLPEPFMTSVVTVPALNLRRQARDIPMDEVDGIMKHRIECMLAVAARYGYRELVLGAWGCGAFGHDPYRVAGYFREVLIDKGYMGFFDAIIFGIMDDGRTNNYLAFIHTLGDCAHLFDLKRAEPVSGNAADADDAANDRVAVADEIDNIRNINNTNTVNENSEAHAANLAGNTVANGGADYPQQFQSDFPYIQYNFSPRNIGRENIGYAHGVTIDGIPYMAEKWEIDGKVDVCFYLPVLEDLIDGMDEAEDEKCEAMAQSAERYDVKGGQMLCIGMVDNCVENEIPVMEAYFEYLDTVGLLEFTTQVRAAYYLLLTDINGNDVFALTVTLEEDGNVLAVTPLRWIPFDNGYGNIGNKESAKPTEPKGSQVQHERQGAASADNQRPALRLVKK